MRRKKLFESLLLLTGHEQGTYLAWYQVLFHFILFPIDTIGYWIAKSSGIRYDPMRDILFFHNNKFSGAFLTMHFTEGKYEIFKENGLYCVRKLPKED